MCSDRKRPVRSGLRSRATGLGFFRGWPDRTAGRSPALRAYPTGRTADIRTLSSDKI